MRFKAASVVKVNKLGAVSSHYPHTCSRVFILLQLVSNFKSLRTNAVDALREISSELVKRAEGEVSADVRKVLADSCGSLVMMGVSISGTLSDRL